MSEPIELNALVAALARDGVIPADAEPPESAADDRPWFVSTLQGIAGWLAGIFGLAFIAAALSLSDSGSYTIFGILLLAAAFGLYKTGRKSVFLDQLALASSIAGQVALAIFFAENANHSIAIPTACVAVLQCLLIFLMPNRLARTLATFFACIAWALAIRFAWWGNGESWDTLQHAVALVPALIGWVGIWIPVAALCAIATRNEASWMAQPPLARIIRPALTGLLLALTFGTFASEPLEALEWFRSSARTPENWLILWPLLNALLALWAAFCAFHLRNKALLGIAIAAALFHVGQFYFLLGTTLVVKSIIMLVVGAVLVASGMALRRT